MPNEIENQSLANRAVAQVPLTSIDIDDRLRWIRVSALPALHWCVRCQAAHHDGDCLSARHPGDRR